MELWYNSPEIVVVYNKKNYNIYGKIIYTIKGGQLEANKNE